MTGLLPHAGRDPSPPPRPFTGVRGLLFDMGDVLYDATLWRRWLLHLLARMGVHTHYRAFYNVWDRKYLDDVHRGRREYDEAFCSFLLAQGLTRGQIDEVLAASAAQKRALAASLRPLPGVRSTVQRLRAAGLTLGVLSDSEDTAPRLQDRLAKLGMPGCFPVVVSSVDVGRIKPDARCYQTALAAMQLAAGQVVFVGHDAEELAGAAAVGLRTIAFNYEPGAKADLHLQRFDDLPNYLSAPDSYAAAG